MSKKRLPTDVLQDDLITYAGLLALEDYTPSNALYALETVKAIKEEMDAKQTTETQKNAAANSSRDDAIDVEHRFHNSMLGVKTQSRAQYGDDSNEVQSLGLKKKSDYKTGRKKIKSNTEK